MTTPAHPHLRYLPEQVVLLGPNATEEQLTRNAHGQLVLSIPGEAEPTAVQPVVAFALTAPRQSISLVDNRGKERGYIEHLDQLPPACKAAVEQALALREFIPTITAITAVDSFSTPSIWHIETDRGSTELRLQSEDDIRKLGDEGKTLRITDKNSLQYQIPDIEALPKASRKLLIRFI
ncbi:DUF1854 domain-containing protein [Lampropedia puyangensis]|uniref:DUF1854 domain-containing protein n=1 Tax=Lampropedia puyangensis TaxID=1330072 RepID=A0A4V4GRN3_9BURK|nr:DUF1854 domain-containing protein [Lampropedia puyangensis]THU02556.1 DUF1854 domain-containing protein [Lampropedia puyangensis]